MRKLFPSAVIATTMLALALLPLAQVHAQATAKPVAIVSIADVGKLKGDINYLAEAAGQQGLAMFGMMAAEQYLQLTARFPCLLASPFCRSKILTRRSP